jgi:DNA-binding NarL/FixJ family response regulator
MAEIIEQIEIQLAGRLDQAKTDALSHARVLIAQQNERASHDPNAAVPKDDKRGPSDKLPPKQQDVSQYFDQAKLTDKQREVMSLKLEYGLSEAEIARRLDKSRKTIYERRHAAQRKFDQLRSNEVRARKRPKNPDYYE